MELEITTTAEIITGLITILTILAVALKFTVKEKSTEIEFTPTSEAATKAQKYESSKNARGCTMDRRKHTGRLGSHKPLPRRTR